MSKRAERRHHTKRVAAARRQLANAFPHGRGATQMSDNALATRHPFDCGSRCFLCHYDKLVLSGQRRQSLKRETDSMVITERETT